MFQMDQRLGFGEFQQHIRTIKSGVFTVIEGYYLHSDVFPSE
jgi:hypothetical protein